MVLLDYQLDAFPDFNCIEGADYQTFYDKVIDVHGSGYCIDLIIFDDSTVEGDESFRFFLNSTDKGTLIQFSIQATTVTIQDNESK